MKINIGDLVSVPMSSDIGIVVGLKEMLVNDYDLQYDTTTLAEVYWQNMGRSRLEIVRDLVKIN